MFGVYYGFTYSTLKTSVTNIYDHITLNTVFYSFHDFIFREC